MGPRKAAAGGKVRGLQDGLDLLLKPQDVLLDRRRGLGAISRLEGFDHHAVILDGRFQVIQPVRGQIPQSQTQGVKVGNCLGI
jgi:hypothetical protein